MSLGLTEARAYLEADKELTSPAPWRPKNNRDGRYPITFFECRVKIGQSMPRGLNFRISVFPTFPDVATFQFECDQPASRTCLTLYRMEWRPISGHGNGLQDHIPPDLRGLIFQPGETHEHICTDNVGIGDQQILKPGVHAARRIQPDFRTYNDALDYVCAKLRIRNPDAIPPSNAQWQLV
ncbi:hypothetical protein [Bosea thiooxidans]